MRWSRFLVSGAVGVAAYIAVPDGLPRVLVYTVVTIGCLVVFAFAGSHRSGDNRLSWALLTVGLAGWVLGDLITAIRVVDTGSVPLVSPADGAYLVGGCAIIASILTVRHRGVRVFHVEDILEALIMAIGLGSAAWILVVGGRSGQPLGLDVLSQYWPVVLYTDIDGFLLALMVVLLLSKRARTVPFVLTALAFLAFVVTGWVSHLAAEDPAVRVVTAVDAGWLVGYVLLTSAALCPTHTLWAAADRTIVRRRAVDRTRLSVLSAAMLVSPVVMGVQLIRGVPVSEWGWVVLGTSVAAVALAGIRISYFLSVLRRQADALTAAAVSDPVTGLANRRRIGTLLDTSLASADEHGVVVFVVDIDRFASINETFGYSVGDQVLCEIGERLVSASVRGALVGRLGGDQFVVSMDASQMSSRASECAEQYRAAVSGTMFVRDINVALDAGVGVAESAHLGGVDAEALLQHAHVAVTAAKRGHTRISVYEPSMDKDRHEQMRLLGELDTAVRERQLRVFFQPCLDLESGAVCGVEALLRWQHPRDGLLAPCSFLPDAERTGLLPSITAYVFEDALRCCADMRRTRPDFRVSINLSVRNLLDTTLVEQVARALRRHGLPASAVEVEVTETSAMTDPSRSVDALVSLRKLGVSVAIDDYGTGYSSLAYLRTLPVQTLKIDKSFVTTMNSEPTNASIVGSTIGLAQSLGMTVVAEGVEDEATLDRLAEMGCDGAQGFHLGPAVATEDLDALVERIEASAHPRATGKLTRAAAQPG